MQVEQILTNVGGRPRRVSLNGKNYLVVPMTTIVHGVLAGSQGPLYYPHDEISRDTAAWNGTPLVVYHPTRNGLPVSAQETADSHVGMALRSSYTGNKLRHEAWFDIEATRRVDKSILQRIENGQPIEVSTGLYTDNEEAPAGSHFNGKPYTHIARNYRPDHIAILPNQTGACSISDGCGVLVNANPEGCNQYKDCGGSVGKPIGKDDYLPSGALVSFHEGEHKGRTVKLGSVIPIRYHKEQRTYRATIQGGNFASESARGITVTHDLLTKYASRIDNILTENLNLEGCNQYKECSEKQQKKFDKHLRKEKGWSKAQWEGIESIMPGTQDTYRETQFQSIKSTERAKKSGLDFAKIIGKKKVDKILEFSVGKEFGKYTGNQIEDPEELDEEEERNEAGQFAAAGGQSSQAKKKPGDKPEKPHAAASKGSAEAVSRVQEFRDTRNADDDVEWITMGGVHIPVKGGKIAAGPMKGQKHKGGGDEQRYQAASKRTADRADSKKQFEESSKRQDWKESRPDKESKERKAAMKDLSKHKVGEVFDHPEFGKVKMTESGIEPVRNEEAMKQSFWQWLGTTLGFTGNTHQARHLSDGQYLPSAGASSKQSQGAAYKGYSELHPDGRGLATLEPEEDDDIGGEDDDHQNPKSGPAELEAAAEEMDLKTTNANPEGCNQYKDCGGQKGEHHPSTVEAVRKIIYRHTQGGKVQRPELSPEQVEGLGKDQYFNQSTLSKAFKNHKEAGKAVRAAYEAKAHLTENDANFVSEAQRKYLLAKEQKESKTKPKSTSNQGARTMPLTRAQMIAKLVVNCKCDEDQETLNQLSDDTLKSLLTTNAFPVKAKAEGSNAGAAAGGAGEDQAGGEEEMEFENEEEESDGNPVGKAAVAKTAPVAMNQRKPTLNEWLESAPEEVRSVVANAVKVTATEKKRLVARLIANVADPKRKAELATKYLRRDIDDLRELVSLIPTRNRSEGPFDIGNLEAIFLGAAAPIGNAGQDSEIDKANILPLPTINYAEWSQEDNKAAQ